MTGERRKSNLLQHCSVDKTLSGAEKVSNWSLYGGRSVH